MFTGLTKLFVFFFSGRRPDFNFESRSDSPLVIHMSLSRVEDNLVLPGAVAGEVDYTGGENLDCVSPGILWKLLLARNICVSSGYLKPSC